MREREWLQSQKAGQDAQEEEEGAQKINNLFVAYKIEFLFRVTKG